MEKPPLGLIPRQFWLERRYHDVLNAIQRYVGQGVQPPIEWLAEAQHLARDLVSPEEVLTFHGE